MRGAPKTSGEKGECASRAEEEEGAEAREYGGAKKKSKTKRKERMRERSGVIGEEARPLAPSEEEGRRGRAMRSPGFAPCKFSCTRAVLPCMHAERAAPALDRLEAFFRIVGLGGAVCSV